MFNFAQNSKVRGSGHLVLNALRAFTIVGLVTVMVSCWAMIVISGLTKHFDFFDTITHFFIFAIAVFLVISEVGLFKAYFHNSWPVLGPDHSLVWLGLASLIMGCSLLGDLVKPAYEIDNLGLPLWRLVMASGVLAMTFGVSNMVVSVIFRDGKSGITARQVRSHGNLAPRNKEAASAYDSNSYTSYGARDNFSQRSASLRHREEEEPRPSAAKRITRMLNPKNMNFRKSRIQISAPMPQFPRDVERGDHHDDRASPIIPAVQRPPTALHPAFTGSSRYSEAHMTRFEEKI